MKLIRIFCIILIAVSGFLNCSNNSVAGGSVDSGNTISGVTIDESGRPAAGVFVQLLHPQHNPVTDEPDAALSATTGEDGRFEITAVDSGIYNLEAHNADKSALLLKKGIPIFKDFELTDAQLSKPGMVVVNLPDYLDMGGGNLYIPGTTVLQGVNSEAVYTLGTVPPMDTFSVVYSSSGDNELTVLSENLNIKSNEAVVISKYSLWSNRAEIMIDPAAAGNPMGSAVTDFPLMLRLNSTNFDFTTAAPDGADLRFTKTDAHTILPYEIERWDNISKTAVVWVKADTVYAGSVTTINMHWGMAAANDYSQSGAVFDTSNGFLGVWHYGDDPSGPAPQMKDATYYGSHGTVIGGATQDHSISAVIGNGLFFDSLVAYYVRMDDVCPLLSDGDPVTFSVWFKKSVPNRTYFIAGGSSTADSEIFRFGLNDSGLVQVVTNLNKENKGPRFDDDVWHQLYGKIDGQGNRTVYVDGIEIPGFTTVDIPPFSSMTNLVSGMDWDSITSDHYDGIMDELRISKTLRSEDWIKLSFENQKQNQTLITFKQGGNK